MRCSVTRMLVILTLVVPSFRSVIQAAGPSATDSNPTAQMATESRRKAIEAQLRSGKSEQITNAFADLRRWFDEDSQAAAGVFWRERSFLIAQSSQVSQIQEMIDLAFKTSAASSRPDRIGYLYALQAACFYYQDKPDDAKNALQKGLSVDRYRTCSEVISTLPKPLMATKRYDDLVRLMVQVVTLVPHDSKIAEPALKQCIAALNAKGSYKESLGFAKSLFNISAMETTGDALTLLDRQLGLVHMEDRTIVEKFRQEQNEGATAPAPGGAARTSDVLKSINVDAGYYNDALEHLVDDSFDATLRHAALLLLSDKASDAFSTAKRAYGQAGNAKEMAAANDMIARCIKAQDGTIGRANTWVSGPANAKN